MIICNSMQFLSEDIVGNDSTFLNLYILWPIYLHLDKNLFKNYEREK